jgi:hypothetical protein
VSTVKVDETRGTRDHTEHLEQVWVFTSNEGTRKVRVRVQVHADFYEIQSWAKAAVLTPSMEWTELATAPPSAWHQQAVRGAADARWAAIEQVAMDLVNRALAILS